MLTVKTLNSPFGMITVVKETPVPKYVQEPLDIPEIARVEAIKKTRKKKSK